MFDVALLVSLQDLEAHTRARLQVLPAPLLANALRMFYRSDHRVSSDFLDDVASRLQVRPHATCHVRHLPSHWPLLHPFATPPRQP